jgi:hypothetical protein
MIINEQNLCKKVRFKFALLVSGYSTDIHITFDTVTFSLFLLLFLFAFRYLVVVYRRHTMQRKMRLSNRKKKKNVYVK